MKITKTASKQLKQLDKIVQKRLILFLRHLQEKDNPRQQGKALYGNQGKLWRYRIGDYRIICHLHDETLTILALAIGHRKEIYTDHTTKLPTLAI